MLHSFPLPLPLPLPPLPTTPLTHVNLSLTVTVLSLTVLSLTVLSLTVLSLTVLSLTVLSLTHVELFETTALVMSSEVFIPLTQAVLNVHGVQMTHVGWQVVEQFIRINAQTSEYFPLYPLQVGYAALICSCC